jgi:hypothetical protein
MGFPRRLLVVVLSFVLMLSTPVYRWDNLGHMAVAYVAYST